MGDYTNGNWRAIRHREKLEGRSEEREQAKLQEQVDRAEDERYLRDAGWSEERIQKAMGSIYTPASAESEVPLSLILDMNDEAWLRVGDRSRQLTSSELRQLALTSAEIAKRLELGGF